MRPQHFTFAASLGCLTSALALTLPVESDPFFQNDGASSNSTLDARGIVLGLPKTTCDYSKTYADLKALDLATATIAKPGSVLANMPMYPIECMSWYALGALVNMLDKAVGDYNNVDNGYDKLFDIYRDYMHDSTPNILKNFMFKLTTPRGGEHWGDGAGMKFFDCTVDGKTTACPDRKGSNGKPFELKLRDANGFNTEIGKLGLSPDWITFGDYTIVDSIPPVKGGGYSELKIPFKNFPIRNDKMVVPNPKDIVLPAIKNIPGLKKDMQATLDDIKAGKWLDVTAPPIVYSVPVLVLLQGIDNMAQAKKVAEEIKKAEEKAAAEKKKNLILLIFSIVLIFVPVVGEELAGAAGLATLARSIAVLGELGNGAIAVYDLVQDPKNGIVGVLGSLFGLGAIARAARTEASIGKLADLRGGISGDTISKFGPLFADNDKLLASILKCT